MATSPIELKSLKDYSAVEKGSNIEPSAVNPMGKAENSFLIDNETSSSSPELSDAVLDEEYEERVWVNFCPWLLKWTWFRNRRYKSKNGSSTFEFYLNLLFNSIEFATIESVGIIMAMMVFSLWQLKHVERVQWDNRAQYILTLVGYAVGLGNLWRFSYLVAKHGGATFIIPYLVMLFIVGIPLFYLESTLGQSLQRGPIKVWYKICPNLWGIGLAGVVVTTIIRIYYNIIIGWVLLYFFHSFQNPLPWSECGGYHVQPKHKDNFNFLNSSVNRSDYGELLSCVNDSTRYFWYNDALQASASLNQMNGFNWKLLLCFLAAWVIVYLCIFKGIKSSGKVVYFTATFPYLVMIIVFFRAVTLEGAGTGLKFLFIPEDGSLTDVFKPQVWLEAAAQIFFSLGLSLGTIIALSSYSKQTNNNLVDSITVCITNSATSLFASIIVFSVVGFKANQLGTHPKLVSQGPGLAFIVITEAITIMPVPQLWSVLFFIMLFLLGLDSHFGGLEVLITVLYDVKAIKKFRKEIVTGVICICLFLLNIPFAISNGFYLFQLVDQFTGTIPLLVLGCCEVMAISFVYGVYRLFDLVKYPVHPKLKFFWWFMWTFVCPLVMVVILLSSFINELVEPLKYTTFMYKNYNDVITDSVELVKTETKLFYPDWAQFIGSILIIGSLSCIPGVFIYRLIRYRTARRQMFEFWELTKERACWVYVKVKGFVIKGNGTEPTEDEMSLDKDDTEESSINE